MENSRTLSKEDIVAIISGTAPKKLTYENIHSSVVAIKYFIFIKQPYTASSGLYERLIEMVRDEQEQFKSLNKVSIYQYNHVDHRGIILKAETMPVAPGAENNFHGTSEAIFTLSEYLMNTYEVRTTTHIGTKILVPESEIVNGYHNVNLNDQTQYALDRIYETGLSNLMTAHDINFNSLNNYSEGHSLRKDFSTASIRYFEKIYSDIQFLDSKALKELRLFYRWVVKKKSKKILSSMLANYAQFESALTDIFEREENVELRRYSESSAYLDRSKKALSNLNRLIDEADNKDKEKLIKIADALRSREFAKLWGLIFKEEHLSLGKIGIFFQTIELAIHKSSKNDLNEFAAQLTDLIEQIKTISNNRNQVAHGRVTEIFKVEWL